MSVRKHIRHSEGHYEKIGLLNESESKYSSKPNHNSVHHDLSASKEKDTVHNSHVNSSKKKLEYSNISPTQTKSYSKSSYQRDAQRARGSVSSPNDRHGNSSHSSRRYKIYNNDDDVYDDCDWSQHLSSSGKTYFYNKRTEQSQWEKPKEWLEREARLKARERKIRDSARDAAIRDAAIREAAIREAAIREAAIRDATIREAAIREAAIRDSKDSNKYSRTSPYKKEYSSNRHSSHSKRNHEFIEVERSKVVRTYGSNTSTSTTISNRSSGCPTPDGYVVSPKSTSLSSVQDISPPSTPSNSSITVLSPYINSSSTPGHVTSAELFTQSPGLSLSNQNSCLVTGSYSSPSANNRSQYLQSQFRNYSSSTTIAQVYQNADQDNTSTSEPISPAPVLHPLQQATLLHQQQLVGALPLMISSPIIQQTYSQSPQAIIKEYHRNSVSGEVEQPPPPPPQQRLLVTPPPPPPPHDELETEMSKIELANNSYMSTGYVNNKTDNALPVSSSQSYRLCRSRPTDARIRPDSRSRPESPLVTRKRQKSGIEVEPKLTELCNLQPFACYCDRSILDNVSSLYGNVLERQANIYWHDAMMRLLGDAEQSRSTSFLVNLASGIVETRVNVTNHRISSLREVTQQLERLQDSKGSS